MNLMKKNILCLPLAFCFIACGTSKYRTHLHDDGVKTTSSKLLAKRIDGNTTQVITSASTKAMYPSTGANNISFVTPEGELYVINIKE